MSEPTLQTPRARVKYLGSARSGTQAVWYQRLTSFALLPLTVAFVVIVAGLAKADLASARAMLGAPCPAILLSLFILAGVWHMSIGMRVIIEDYVQHHHAKELALMANTCFAAGVGLSCVYAILRLSFTQ